VALGSRLSALGSRSRRTRLFSRLRRRAQSLGACLSNENTLLVGRLRRQKIPMISKILRA
jgi:hypothetical protein